MLLAEVRYALVAQPAFLKSQAPANHPLDLIKWPSIRNHIDGLLLPWRLVHNSESFDVDPVNPLLSDDLLVSASLALCGAGLANLPMPLVKDHIARGELVSVFEQWMPPSRNLFLVYANREHRPSKSIVFIDFFKEKQLEVQSLLADTR